MADRTAETKEKIALLSTPPGQLNRIIAELMTRDEPAFTEQRVANFRRALSAAGYTIVRVGGK